MKSKRLRPPLPSQALDRRTAAHRHVADVKARLADFVGGNPTEAEKEIIDRCAMLSLQISQMERFVSEGGSLGEDNPAHYIAFTKAYCEIFQYAAAARASGSFKCLGRKPA